MKKLKELKIESPTAAAQVLTDANLHIRIIFLKEGPAKNVDEGLIAETTYVIVMRRNLSIVRIRPTLKSGHHNNNF